MTSDQVKKVVYLCVKRKGMDINELFAFVQKRDYTTPVKLSSVPEELRKDLLDFIHGMTVAKVDGEYAVYPADFIAWLDKLEKEGLNYDLTVHPH